jgi:integrase
VAKRRGKTARRQRGEGSPRYRPDQELWEHRIWITPPDGGERRRISVYAPSSSELVAKVSEIRGTPPGKVDELASPLSVGKLLHMWLDAIQPGTKTIGRRAGLRAGTWERYENIVRIHLKPIHHLALGRLTTDRIDLLIKDAKGSPRTREMIGQVLRTALNWAVRRQLLARNPASEARLPDLDSRPVPSFTTSTVNEILAAVVGHPLEALFTLAVMTGARQGELLALTAQDVFLDNRTEGGGPGYPAIVIRHTLVWGPDGAGFAPVKTASTSDSHGRTVPLNKTAVRALERHFDRMIKSGLFEEVIMTRMLDQLKFLNTLEWVDGVPIKRLPPPAANDYYTAGQKRGRPNNARLKDLIFVTGSGAPTRAKATGGIMSQWRAIQREHGLPAMTFHDLRHVAASMMLQASGGNLFEVSRILGHADTRMLQRTYGHLLGHGRGAIEALEELLDEDRKASKGSRNKAPRARNQRVGGVKGGTKRTR